MSRRFQIVAGLLAVIVPQLLPQMAFAAKPKNPPKIRFEFGQTPTPVTTGSTAELTVALVPPEGIVLNRYPGITLRLTDSDEVEAKTTEAFLGSKEPIENVEEFYFDTIEPMKLTVVPRTDSKGKQEVDATVSYFYCVKASGYCAPRREAIQIPIIVESNDGN